MIRLQLPAYKRASTAGVNYTKSSQLTQNGNSQLITFLVEAWSVKSHLSTSAADKTHTNPRRPPHKIIKVALHGRLTSHVTKQDRGYYRFSLSLTREGANEGKAAFRPKE